MRIHYLQHVAFEDAANIEVWAAACDLPVTRSRLYDREPLPSLDAFDALVIMGGPMNIYQEVAYPWLVAEKHLIERAIESKKLVLGVCLGAQLIADVLGGTVTQNPHKEIGWFPVELTPQGRQCPFLRHCPKSFMAFHWHGDTFSIPPETERLAQSVACANQAFSYRDHVLALQFHLEYCVESIEKMIKHCGDELCAEPFIQSADEIRASYHNVSAIRSMLDQLLDEFYSLGNNRRRVARLRH